jgi:hypothetical protein
VSEATNGTGPARTGCDRDRGDPPRPARRPPVEMTLRDGVLAADGRTIRPEDAVHLPPCEPSKIIGIAAWRPGLQAGEETPLPPLTCLLIHNGSFW